MRFPISTRTCAQAFQRETELFLESQLREDRSVLDLLTANYTFVNERLARHYGIPNVYGSHFRRVTLQRRPARRPARPGQHPDGDLVSRTGPRRSARQVAAREHPRRAAAAAAAQRAGAAGSRAPSGKPTSVRERMEQHRSNPVCASCHARMDPLGFALENFDAIGRWRTADEADTPIDASGTLPDGTKFDGPAELPSAAAGAPRAASSRPSTEKLLTYALGRGVEYYDMPAVRKIMRDGGAGDYRWSSLMLGNRQEHAVSDEEVGSHDHHQESTSRAAPSCADWRDARAAAARQHGAGVHARAEDGGQAGHAASASIYVPNGAIMTNWTPATEGTGFELDADPRAARRRFAIGCWC